MPTKTAPEKLRCNQLLQELPVKFHFLQASPQDKSRVLNRLGQLVAQEYTLSATAADADETGRYVVATRCQQVNVQSIRHQFEQLLAARQYCEQHAADAEQNELDACQAKDRLAEQLAKVHSQYGQAESQWQAAQAIRERVKQAEQQLATQCEVLHPALSHWTTLQ